MRIVVFSDVFIIYAASGRYQIAVICEERSVEPVALYVVRADFKTQPAFEALGCGVLMLMLFAGDGLYIP